MKIYLGHRLETEEKQTWLQGVHKFCLHILGIWQFLTGVVYLCTSRGKHRTRGGFVLDHLVVDVFDVGDGVFVGVALVLCCC